MIMLSIFLAATASIAAPQDDPLRETPLGSRLSKPIPTREYEADRVRQIQSGYGDCVVKKQPEEAKRFVLTPRFEEVELRKILPKVGDGWCLNEASDAYGGVMKFPADTMRYTLADALVRTEFLTSAPSIADAGPIHHAPLVEADYQPRPGRKARPSELEALARKREMFDASSYMSQFGECVVRGNPAASYHLIMTAVLSPQESEAFKALISTFGSCVTAGQTFKLDKAAVRGTIAMNLYRLAHAPRITAAPGAQH